TARASSVLVARYPCHAFARSSEASQLAGRMPALRCRSNPRGQQQIRPEPAPFDLVELNDFVQPLHALAGDRFPRVATAQDFGRVKKRDALRKTTEQKRRVRFAAAFDQQAR